MGKGVVDPHDIKNRIKRSEVLHRRKEQRREERRKQRDQRQRERKELGDEAPPPPEPKSLDKLREKDDTIVDADDEEVQMDELQDEFADYFAGKIPKSVITTGPDPSLRLKKFVEDLSNVFPNSHVRPRRKFTIKEIVAEAIKHEFTDLIVVDEHRKKPCAMWIVHLPNGPTAEFKLSNSRLPSEIKGHGSTTEHRPEVILNNFNTRLGHQVGRMMAALFPHDPEFRGRRVCTFHNQRDFIFFRHHRYVFDSDKKARLQELGPRFTLKLKSLQKGTFDTTTGEYEWIHKTEMDTSRRRFFL